MDQHLTVKEATQLVGKSESTIKRMIREIVNVPDHPDRVSISPAHKEIERRKAAGEPYVWKIDRTLLLRRYPPAETTEEGTDDSPPSRQTTEGRAIIEVLREQLDSKDQQLRTLETQLDRKDEQISNLNERMRESNILMKELQERLALAPPVHATHDAVVSEPSKPSPKPNDPRPFIDKHLPSFAAIFRRK